MAQEKCKACGADVSHVKPHHELPDGTTEARCPECDVPFIRSVRQTEAAARRAPAEPVSDPETEQEAEPETEPEPEESPEE